MGGEEVMMKPAWLEGLMAESFFAACGYHHNRRKNEKNIFCLDCCQSFCPHCLSQHRSHPLLQVRRYLYQDVIRLDDLQRLIDCSYIQPYTINGAKVIFLTQRAQSRSNCKGSVNTCLTCHRILQEPFNFCSLSCKVDYVVYQGQDLSTILHRFNRSDFSFSQFDGLRMDGSDLPDDDDDDDDDDSILEYKGSSCSNNNNNSREMEIFKKKKKGNGFLPRIMLSLSNRRKGAPHRSPLS